jgi:hypothetical protein
MSERMPAANTTKRRSFDKRLAEICAGFAGLPPEPLRPLVEEAVAAARKRPQ